MSNTLYSGDYNHIKIAKMYMIRIIKQEKRIQMRKLVCKKCNMIWYTSNAFDSEVCDNCGESLTEVTEETINEEKRA